jgi:putative CocE/NonD family hydrolase
MGSTMGFMDRKTNFTAETIRWFDRWLKGDENGIDQEKPVKYFVLGENCWAESNEFLSESFSDLTLYFHKNGKLSSRISSVSGYDEYIYDPENPVQTVGGATHMNASFGMGIKDQSAIECRDDVLTYSTDVLEEDIPVFGPVKVTLFASSSTPDTDFIARLVDVHPDGFVQNLTDGIIRARYRDGISNEALMEPGNVYKFEIDLWYTAAVFKKGHRIRLDVTSSNYPRWDRNLNTGKAFGMDAEVRIAEQKIHFSQDYPSRLILQQRLK